MIDLSSAVLPYGIKVHNNIYHIQTSFHYALLFIKKREEGIKDLSEYSFMYKEAIPAMYEKEAFEKILKFIYPESILPRVEGEESNEKVLDYFIDGSLIYSAFYKCYGIDLYKEDLHWHKFLSLLNGIEDTKLNTIIEFRCYNRGREKENDYTRYMEKKKREWALPYIHTKEEESALKEYEECFKE